MDYFFSLVFENSEKYLKFRKKTKAFAKENILLNPHKQPDLRTAELFFKLYISQKYVPNLEKNCKTLFVSVFSNLANL